MKHRLLHTVTGEFALVQHDDGSLSTTWLTPQARRMLKNSREDARLLPHLSRRLQQYFSGAAVDFSDVELPAGPDFYQACWAACRRIELGETRTYAQLAVMAGGDASAARAAGQAMRHNPLPIITPCHRVIGASGKLHGFGGSLDRRGRELSIKAALLRLEAAFPAGDHSSGPTRTEAQTRPRRVVAC